MVLVIKGLPLNWMSKLPGWILHPLFSLMLRGEERNEITELLLTFVLEAKEGIRLDSTYERYRNIQAETLLLGGGNSPNFLLDVLPILAKTIPNVRTMKLPGLDHTAPDEDAPEAVASVLREFFNE